MGNVPSKPSAGVPRVHFDVRLSSETCSASGKRPFYIHFFLTNLEAHAITIDIARTLLSFPQAMRKQRDNKFMDVESGDYVMPYDASKSITCYMLPAPEYKFRSDHYITLYPRHEQRINYVLNYPSSYLDCGYSSDKAEKLLDLSKLERNKWYRILLDDSEVHWWCYGDMDFVAQNAPTKLPYHPPGDIGKPPPIILKRASEDELKFRIVGEKEKKEDERA